MRRKRWRHGSRVMQQQQQQQQKWVEWGQNSTSTVIVAIPFTLQLDFLNWSFNFGGCNSFWIDFSAALHFFRKQKCLGDFNCQFSHWISFGKRSNFDQFLTNYWVVFLLIFFNHFLTRFWWINDQFLTNYRFFFYLFITDFWLIFDQLLIRYFTYL